MLNSKTEKNTYAKRSNRYMCDSNLEELIKEGYTYLGSAVVSGSAITNDIIDEKIDIKVVGGFMGYKRNDGVAYIPFPKDEECSRVDIFIETEDKKPCANFTGSLSDWIDKEFEREIKEARENG